MIDHSTVDVCVAVPRQIQYSTFAELTVKYNNQKTRDYTNPNLPCGPEGGASPNTLANGPADAYSPAYAPLYLDERIIDGGQTRELNATGFAEAKHECCIIMNYKRIFLSIYRTESNTVLGLFV